MRRRIVLLSLLLAFQFASAFIFTVFVAHLAKIWYTRDIGIWEAIETEYTQGGWIMLVETIVVAVAVFGALAFEVWMLVSSSKAERGIIDKLDNIQKSLDNIQRVSDSSPQENNRD